ncbi:hypothetical protein HNY73_003377 [Argiope bruennichi]|uniref:Uncharacterized protein n=1 Tax=Argiope bruennichi TaxID=94029 RepID=A0A8T0FME7_ARGBR|nr:hypothetical protein HNY73_003377 [Argiope bruennichi]
MVISAAPLLTLFRGRGECLMFARQDTGDASAVSSNESGRKTLKAYRTQLRGQWIDRSPLLGAAKVARFVPGQAPGTKHSAVATPHQLHTAKNGAEFLKNITYR